MKLLTIDSREVGGRPGVILNTGEILDLAAAPNTLSESQWIPYSVVSVLAAGADGLARIERWVTSAQRSMGEARDRLLADGVLLPFASTKLMAPVRRPGLILVVGSDSSAHLKSPNTAVGNDSTVIIPSTLEESVTVSGMLAAVIGREVYQVGLKEAETAIAGYTLLIDLSSPEPARDAPLTEWQRYWDSKQFPGACPIGPAIITRDELPNPGDVDATVRINDVEVGRGRICGGQSSIAEKLARASRRFSFRPGDLVAIECESDDVGRPRSVSVGDEYTLELPQLMELTVKLS